MSDPAPSCCFPWYHLLLYGQALSILWGQLGPLSAEPPAHALARIIGVQGASGGACDMLTGSEDQVRLTPGPAGRGTGDPILVLPPERGPGHSADSSYTWSSQWTRAQTVDTCPMGGRSEAPQQMGKWSFQGPRGSCVPIIAGARCRGQPPRGMDGPAQQRGPRRCGQIAGSLKVDM